MAELREEHGMAWRFKAEVHPVSVYIAKITYKMTRSILRIYHGQTAGQEGASCILHTLRLSYSPQPTSTDLEAPTKRIPKREYAKSGQ